LSALWRDDIYILGMRKSLVYYVTIKVGVGYVGATNHGVYEVKRRLAKLSGSGYEILETLSGPDELLGVKLKHLANFIKQDFILDHNTKAEKKLATKLFMGTKCKRKGNAVNLRRKPKFDW